MGAPRAKPWASLTELKCVTPVDVKEALGGQRCLCWRRCGLFRLRRVVVVHSLPLSHQCRVRPMLVGEDARLPDPFSDYGSRDTPGFEKS